ncbi:hypothetical protein [Armatimonas rosea]|uniref:Uncharacterized protein n=1 Tax=Armatimonas rosea TaxID=685828 RepID=A0A7W9SY80_ARMRO|nr:hypothetical protein [Armatimonas rosea]MBB6054118.1 hypothetical protein [Armatimonas rosea]
MESIFTERDLAEFAMEYGPDQEREREEYEAEGHHAPELSDEELEPFAE